MSVRVAQIEDKFAEGVVLSEDNVHMDDNPNKYTASRREQVATICGRYLKLGNVGGTPIFRQDAPEDDEAINSHQLYLWRNDECPEASHRGWYFTKYLGNELFNEEGNIFGWGRSRPGEPHTFPTTVLLPPFSGGKNEPAILCESYAKFLEGTLEMELVSKAASASVAEDGTELTLEDAEVWRTRASNLIKACHAKDWKQWKKLVAQAEEDPMVHAYLHA